MKKAVIYLSLFLMVGLLSCRKVEKEQREADKMDDSFARIESEKIAREQASQDSIENVEMAKAEAERLRIDSLRQDSINREKKMKLGQLSFISHNGDWKKILPKFGFKLTSKKTYTRPNDYDEDETWVITDYVYTRDLNGRKVTFKFDTYDGYGDYCATMIIHDPEEKEKFIQDIRKLNKMKVSDDVGEIWKASNIDHYLRYWRGEFIFDTDH